KAWSLQDELDLLELLRILDSKNIRFAFSNVIFHKDKEHYVLKDWLQKHQKFKVHYLDFTIKTAIIKQKKQNLVKC
ncbi:hypothetical protein ACTSAC_001851, partial [Campylobacter jejuni]